MRHPHDGGPAFPPARPGAPQAAGMSLREYYAAHAAMGLMANLDIRHVITSGWNPDELAALALAAADALLRATGKGGAA